MDIRLQISKNIKFQSLIDNLKTFKFCKQLNYSQIHYTLNNSNLKIIFLYIYQRVTFNRVHNKIILFTLTILTVFSLPNQIELYAESCGNIANAN